MQIRNGLFSKRLEKRDLVPSFCLVLLYLFTHVVALAAQEPGTQSPSTHSASAGAQTPVHDLTMSGAVQHLITAHTSGALAGFQLVVNGPQGSFTASLGSSLSREMQQSLLQDTPVQISGTMQTIDGEQYLLARKLTVNGNQIVIRNENGFLVHTKSRSGASIKNSALYRSAK